MGGRHVADYRSLPAFVLNQIVIKHDQNVIGMEEFTRIVDNAYAVGISVGGDTDVALSVYHVILQASQRKCGRRRQFSSEQRVVLFVNHLYVTACRRQNGPQRRVADTVHGVDGNS